MTQTIEVYTAASSATTAPRVNPARELADAFPWTATSTETPDQAWFWTPEWQAGERQVDREIAAGNLSPVYDSLDELFADLDDDPA